VVILIRNKTLLGIPKDAIVIFINTSIAGERLANRDYFTKNEKVIIPNVEMPGVTNKAKAIIKGINEFEKIESGKKSSKL